MLSIAKTVCSWRLYPIDLHSFPILFPVRILGHLFARHTAGANAHTSIHIVGRGKNTFNFRRCGFFARLRCEINPFILFAFAFLIDFLETLLLAKFFLFQIFLVVVAIASEN